MCRIEIGYDIRNHGPGEKLIVTTDTPWLTIRSWNFLREVITSAEKRTRRVMCMSYIFSTSNSPALSPHSTIQSFMGPCVV